MKRFGTWAVAAGFMAAMASPSAARELQLGSVSPPTSPWTKGYNLFAEMVAEASGGELTIKVFPAGQLGQEQDMVRQMARGRIDMIAVTNTAMSLLVPEIGLLSAPYIFTSTEQADCTYAKLSDTFKEPLNEAGATTLAWLEVGNQIIITKDALAKTPEDLAGQKLRTAPTASDTLYTKETGASPVPLGIPETMQSLQTGGITGATFPTVFVVAAGFHKVAPYLTVTNHVYQVGSLMVSNRIWDQLSEEEKGWLQQSATESFATLRQNIRDAEVALLKQAEAEGATVYRPTEDEMANWRAVAEAAYPTIVADYGGDADAVWSSIQDTVASCEG